MKGNTLHQGEHQRHGVVGHFLGAIVGHVTQRYAHICPDFAVNIVKAHLGRNEDTALRHLLAILFWDVIDADDRIAVGPLLFGDISIALAKFGAVTGHTGFFDVSSVGPAHGGPQYAITHNSPLK
jgi:hypothetical protein